MTNTIDFQENISSHYCQVIVGTILTRTLSYAVMVPFKDRSHCLLLVAVLNSCFALIKYRREQMSFSGIHHLLSKAVFCNNPTNNYATLYFMNDKSRIQLNPAS